MEKESSTTERDRPASPGLVAPREATVVDGHEVTFEWQPVEAADAYRVQVAEDTSFETIVFETTVEPTVEPPVEPAPELTVTDVFPTNEQTFFWRVLAQNEAGWSRGERVESFVSATAGEMEAHAAQPDAEEEMGPVTELVKAASRQAVAEVSDSKEDRLEQEKEMGVAYEGIPAGQIISIAVTLLLAIAIAVVILFMWTNTTRQAIREATINTDQYTQLRETEAQAAQKLSQYEVIDAQAGTYRIPIDRAMDIMANQAYQEGTRSYAPDAPLQGQQ